jgi:hypothetical protein
VVKAQANKAMDSKTTIALVANKAMAPANRVTIPLVSKMTPTAGVSSNTISTNMEAEMTVMAPAIPATDLEIKVRPDPTIMALAIKANMVPGTKASMDPTTLQAVDRKAERERVMAKGVSKVTETKEVSKDMETKEMTTTEGCFELVAIYGWIYYTY